MTPEEHIAIAEELLEISGTLDDDLDIHALRIRKAAVHIQVAEFKKRYPSDSGRPLARYPSGRVPYPALPDDHPMNRGRPVPDNPQG